MLAIDALSSSTSTFTSQYACKGCETVTSAAVPARVIDGGMVASGLVNWVLVSKYV